MRTNALADVSLMTKDKTWIRSVSRFLRRQRSRLPLVRSMLQSSSRRNSNTLSSRSSSNRTPVAFSRSRQAVSIPVYDKCMSNENESYSYRISSSTDQTDNMCVSTPSQPPATLHICDTCKSSINWYFGSISRQVTEIILQSQPVGAFIVRNSSSRNGNFALSVRVVEDEYRPTGVAHYLLVKSAKNRVQIKVSLGRLTGTTRLIFFCSISSHRASRQTSTVS